MIKWVLTLTFFVMGFPIFSDETPSEFHHSLQEWQNEALLRLSYGNAYLLSGESWQALEQFQKAKVLLDKSDSSSCPLEFLITFGQVIAYDCLGFHDYCKQAVGSLFLSINQQDMMTKMKRTHLLRKMNGVRW